MLPDRITVSFRRPLPVVVDGGLTRWKINYDVHGKNGSHLEVFAACLDDRRYITIATGRARWMDNQRRGRDLFARRGTPDGDLLVRIFVRAVQLGLAENADPAAGACD